MIDSRQKARSYLSLPGGAPCRWADGGKVLTWRDGTTIAFLEEIVEIIGSMSSNELPPFPAMTLLLAACRGKFPTAPANHNFSDEEFSEFLTRLRTIHELPARGKGSPGAKAVLIEMVFGNVNPNTIQPRREILESLKSFSPFDDLDEGASVGNNLSCRLLISGLRNFSADAFRLRLETGIDLLPEAADLELSPCKRARHLLDQLQNDPEQQGLAKAARDIMAALYLPRSVSEQGELALGGFSDISNRGSLDRLLLSELAHDDNTLAVRIALNEALYFRREPPLNHPPGRFAMLIDVGLRQWGLPRVFATSVALAFMAQDRCDEISVWRAKRKGIESCDLLTRVGLEQHLGSLDTYVHPGGALQSFFAQIEAGDATEVVLVTHRDSLADTGFQHALAEISFGTLYIATVDRDGTFELALYPHWNKPICKAKIALEDLFSTQAPVLKKRTAPSLLDETSHSDLPAIFRADPFPLKLPILGKKDHAIHLPNGGGAVLLKDRRLLQWSKAGQGASTLVETLPPGKTIWMGTTGSGTKLCVLKHHSKQSTAALVCCPIDGGETDIHEIPNFKEPLRAFERNGILFLVYRDEITSLDLNSGLTSGSIKHHTTRSHSRFFESGNHWSFITFDGSEVLLEPVQFQFSATAEIIALFDRSGLESLPWALTSLGEVYAGDGKRVINLGRQTQTFEISEDGNKIVVPGVSGRDCHLIDLTQNACSMVSPSIAQRILNPTVNLPTRGVRVNFTEVGFEANGDICLKGRKGEWQKICLAADRIQMVAALGIAPTKIQQLERLPLPSHFNLTLKSASWPDGSKVWIDSRGLLHLKRGNSSNPEVSLVLTNGAMAVWSSDGRICGPEFFAGDQEQDAPAMLMKRIEMCSPML